MVTFLETRGKNANHALMPVWFEQTKAEGHRLQWQVLELGQCFALHALLDGFAVLV
ncbi:hypothetical protein D3C79_903990 [compost metagenome]